MITLHGIPNCDTVKKARRWLDEQGEALVLDTEADVLRALNRAAHALDLPAAEDTTTAAALTRWTLAWKARLQSRA